MSDMPMKATNLGTHKVCGGMLIELEVDHTVIEQTGNCVCDEPEWCEEQHEETYQKLLYYVCCTGDCGAIRSVSVYPYLNQPANCRYILPIEASK